jgi:MOSC domain-containing protein YiiM
LETALRVGDMLRIGTTELVVTQPRMPCFKLNVHFQRPDMVKRFMRAGRTGFYLAVVKEGHLGAGDPLDLVPTDEHAISVAEVQPGVTTFAPGFGRLIRERVRRGGTR